MLRFCWISGVVDSFPEFNVFAHCFGDLWDLKFVCELRDCFTSQQQKGRKEKRNAKRNEWRTRKP